eukprot:gene10069-3826_t
MKDGEVATAAVAELGAASTNTSRNIDVGERIGRGGSTCVMHVSRKGGDLAAKTFAARQDLEDRMANIQLAQLRRVGSIDETAQGSRQTSAKGGGGGGGSNTCDAIPLDWNTLDVPLRSPLNHPSSMLDIATPRNVPPFS